jgi:hypothetical protein
MDLEYEFGHFLFFREKHFIHLEFVAIVSRLKTI